MEKIKVIFNWMKKNPLEFWILAAILLVAAFFRFYKIDQYMTFLGDEGRDVIIVRRLLTEGHPPLIGPGTSIGSMYLGPLYYYMMAPALLLANFSPVGPAIQIALLGIITIAFVWWIGREWFGRTAGLIAAGLYAISPTVIVYSRSSWNPNIMPFFALLSVYSIWKAWKDRKFNWLIVLGISYAFVLQSHYLGLLLAPTLFTIWLIIYFRAKKSASYKVFVRRSLAGAALFLLLMSPLLIFDMRHNWINSQAIYKFFTVRQETVSIRPWNAIPKFPELLEQINLSLIAGKNNLLAAAVSIAIGVWALYLILKRKALGPDLILLLWLSFALIGFGVYKQHVYDHYFGFIFATPFLIIGSVLSAFIKRGGVAKILSAIAILILVVFNLKENPIKYTPNNQLRRASNVAGKIEQESGGQSFNLAVLAERNYPDGYKYFLLKNRDKIVDIDAQKPETITDQLFVVCELEPAKCDPTHSPKAEVANFGWSEIVNQWTVDGITLYKMEHTKK
jgi:4-amino-4-deoxy-L-arabinose transferase-like glycosyltransferase